MPKVASPKKHRLTLAQLSTYDDILTDALVDHVYFWTEIRKNKNAYHAARNITEEAVTSILQKRVIIERDPGTAATELLALDGLRKFFNNLKTEPEKKDFQQHLRRYVNIYMTDCPWEVSTTNRYTLVTQEAAVTARRVIKKGEVVKYLCGVQVQLTEDEEDLIKSKAKDFSIVVSSRSKTASLFLGPARFANHDCNANARLKTTGPNGMEIVAYERIEEGAEVTVSYGDNYFGEDNCECLCRTCESFGRNGWTARDTNDAAPKQSIEASNDDSGNYSKRLRQKIRRDSAASRSPSMTPDINIRPHVSKRTPKAPRFKVANSPLGKTMAIDSNSLLEEATSPLKRKLEPQASENAPDTPSRKRMKTSLSTEIKDEETTQPNPFEVPTLSSTSSNNSPTFSPSPSASDNNVGTTATSVDGDETLVEHGVISAPTFKLDSLPTTEGATSETAKLLAQADAGESILVDASTSAEHPAVTNETAAAESPAPEVNESGNDASPAAKGRQKRKKRRFQPRSDKEYAPAIRYPGDYVLTPALLSEPAMSWIVCKNCEEAFVQANAYFTRSACPRCERHSKLYGYCWPKTDKEDSDDDEERVLDHRTIHRFIKPDEEKHSRKLARQSSGLLAARAETKETGEAPKTCTPKPNGTKKASDKQKGSGLEDNTATEASPGRRSSRQKVKRVLSF